MNRPDIPTVTIAEGVRLPLIGVGVYQIDDPKMCRQVVSTALELGYRMVDTAAVYGNEAAVGAAIREAALPREQLFIQSKLWVQDFGYDAALRGFESSMSALGLDYIDLYMLHKPYNDYYGAWRALARLHREGRIRAIGVTSFWPERLADFCHFQDLQPAVNQVETNVWHQQWTASVHMQALGVHHQAWAPFAEGIHDVFHNVTLAHIAARHHKTVAQVMVRWLLQRGVSVVPKSVHADRLAENIDVFDFSLDDSDMALIRTLDQGRSLLSDDMDLDEATGMITLKIHD